MRCTSGWRLTVFVALALPACSFGEDTGAPRMWANGDLVVTVTDSAMTLRFACLQVTATPPPSLERGTFSVPGNFDNLNYHGTVTIRGAIAGEALTLDLVPGTAPANTARHETVTLGAEPPPWYPSGATCAD